MPWSKRQVDTARALLHGFRPTGSARGFTRDFAEQVVREGAKGKKKKKHRRGTIADLGR